MDPKISSKDKLKKVEDILGTLGLTKVQDTLVGLSSGKLRGISGKIMKLFVCTLLVIKIKGYFQRRYKSICIKTQSMTVSTPK